MKPETGSTGPDDYVELASALASGPLKSRSGFGALRHFDNVLRDTMGLVLESSFFVHTTHPEAAIWPMAHPDFFDFFLRRRPRPNHRFFVESMLASPEAYDPKPLWALFWAMAKAEHEFVRRFIPFWSHEERLTGHLVAQIVERLEDFGTHWRNLDTQGDSESTCSIWYADTATARREATTGADLGLVVHAKFPNANEFFKVARFQAKKADTRGKARIDLDQLENLLRQDGLGFYLFYHQLDPKRWTLPPTVRPASHFRGELENARSEMEERLHRKRPTKQPTVESTQRRYDIATFITFALADPVSEHGVVASDPRDATRALMASNLPLPSRVLVVTLGSGFTVVNWGGATPGLRRVRRGRGVCHVCMDDSGKIHMP